MEYIPETAYQILKSYTKNKQFMPMILSKLYIYQLSRGLAYLHSLGITHRDIKPQNMLIDPNTHIMKLCDFGSAKRLVKGEPNISYISSRFYRAPELILGCTDYSTQIDVWSMGCILAEFLLGSPVFLGDNNMNQLKEIRKILRNPSPHDLISMKVDRIDFSPKSGKAIPWEKVSKFSSLFLLGIFKENNARGNRFSFKTTGIHAGRSYETD